MSLYAREFLTVCQNPVNFGGHRHCCSGNTMVLVRHAILQDNVIKGSCEFMSSSLLWQISTLLSLVVIGIRRVRYIF